MTKRQKIVLHTPTGERTIYRTVEVVSEPNAAGMVRIQAVDADPQHPDYIGEWGWIKPEALLDDSDYESGAIVTATDEIENDTLTVESTETQHAFVITITNADGDYMSMYLNRENWMEFLTHATQAL